MIKKQSKPERNFEIMHNASKSAKLALKNGLGPAHNSNKVFGVIPGKIVNNTGYVIIVEKGENGNRSKPVDWYAWSAESGSTLGFGGWYKYSYDDFVKANPWVKDEWDSLKK